MEVFEHSLEQLDKHQKESIQKHKDLLAESIFNVSKNSNKLAANFDLNFKKNFPGIINMGNRDQKFTPKLYVKYVKGKGFK